MYKEADRAAAMLEAGARAYLNKTVDADALLNMIRTIGVGDSSG
jgi:DNA-binding NarL/FixJ family response regulator